MPPTKCKCVRCPFGCNTKKWEPDCCGCDGSGIETKCDACFGPECTSEDCETRVLVPKRDTDGLPFCAECFEYLKKEMPDAD